MTAQDRHVRLLVATIAVGVFFNAAADLLTDYLAFGRDLTSLQALGLILIIVAGFAINMGWNMFKRPNKIKI